VLEGVKRVELDERWHIGFGLRCLIDARPPADVIDTVLVQAEEAAAAWGDAVPEHIRERIAPVCRRRLSYARLIGTRAAAA
jgi:ribonucleoside-diphosphate reductase beta chain